MSDPIVDFVRAKLAERSAAGIKKYGTTVARTDLTRLDWLRHAQEELLDGAVYLERLIQDKSLAAAPQAPADARDAEILRLRTLARDARAAWNIDKDVRVGKLLFAMTDDAFCRTYRPDLFAAQPGKEGE
jgi:hypothetical protein